MTFWHSTKLECVAGSFKKISHLVFPQHQSSISVTWSTTWMRATVTLKCGFGEQEVTSPNPERSRCALEKQTRFQLKVCIKLTARNIACFKIAFISCYMLLNLNCVKFTSRENVCCYRPQNIFHAYKCPTGVCKPDRAFIQCLYMRQSVHSLMLSKQPGHVQTIK